MRILVYGHAQRVRNRTLIRPTDRKQRAKLGTGKGPIKQRHFIEAPIKEITRHIENAAAANVEFKRSRSVIATGQRGCACDTVVHLDAQKPVIQS